MSALLLLLADGRLPAGGHAHSGGIEAAVAAGLVSDVSDLGRWLDGRLATTGRVDAAVAVAGLRIAAGRLAADRGGRRVSSGPGALAALDEEAAARMASPALRTASRAQGRGLLRVGRRCWTDPLLDELAGVDAGGPLAAVALGVTGALGDLGSVEVAAASLWSTLSGPAWAAVRLLGLDPLGMTAAIARRTQSVDRYAAEAAEEWGAGDRSLSELPASSAPLLDIGAEDHAAWEVRLFAS